MPTALVATSTPAGPDQPFFGEVREAGLGVVYPREWKPLTEDDLIAELRGVSAVIAGRKPYNRRVTEVHGEVVPPVIACIRFRGLA